MKKDNFLEELYLLVELTQPQKEPTERVLDFYLEELSSYPEESIKEMFRIAKRDCKFFPKLPELREMIPDNYGQENFLSAKQVRELSRAWMEERRSLTHD